MIEAGLRPGDQIGLRRPLNAMTFFAGDPGCWQAFPETRRKPVTAVGIQRHYLALAEAHRDAPFMPPWAGEVCRQWRRALDLIETGCPESVATSLDWAIRFNIVGQFLRAQGYDWLSVQKWNLIVESIGQAAETENLPENVPSAEIVWKEEKLLEKISPQFERQFPRQGVTIGAFRKFRELRSRVFELDTRFGQLGNGGLFAQLDQAGVLHHHFQGVDNFEHAMEFPPAIGRANLRGACVLRLGSNSGSPGYVCDWASIWDRSKNRLLDLSDPFVQRENWKGLTRESDPDLSSILMGRHPQLLDLLGNARGR
jgi:hypothetical protein